MVAGRPRSQCGSGSQWRLRRVAETPVYRPGMAGPAGFDGWPSSLSWRGSRVHVGIVRHPADGVQKTRSPRRRSTASHLRGHRHLQSIVTGQSALSAFASQRCQRYRFSTGRCRRRSRRCRRRTGSPWYTRDLRASVDRSSCLEPVAYRDATRNVSWRAVARSWVVLPR